MPPGHHEELEAAPDLQLPQCLGAQASQCLMETPWLSILHNLTRLTSLRRPVGKLPIPTRVQVSQGLIGIQYSPVATPPRFRGCWAARNRSPSSQEHMPRSVCGLLLRDLGPTGTSAAGSRKASAILLYSSLTLVKPSMRPVGLPWASWVWNTRRGRRAAGGGGKPIWDSPAPLPPRGPGSPTPSPLRLGSASSFSTRGGAFFLRPSPSGMSSQKWGVGQETCRTGIGFIP